MPRVPKTEPGGSDGIDLKIRVTWYREWLGPADQLEKLGARGNSPNRSPRDLVQGYTMNSWYKYRAGVVILSCDGHFGTLKKYVFQPDVAVVKSD